MILDTAKSKEMTNLVEEDIVALRRLPVQLQPKLPD